MKKANNIEVGEDFLIDGQVIFTRPAYDVYIVSAWIMLRDEFTVEKVLTPENLAHYKERGLEAIVAIANSLFDKHRSLCRIDKPWDEVEVVWRGKEE